jgi:hypothetical protein
MLLVKPYPLPSNELLPIVERPDPITPNTILAAADEYNIGGGDYLLLRYSD